MVFGNRESRSRRQLVISVKRRRVASPAAFLTEDLLATHGLTVELVRVWRRLERINVKRQGIELLIAVSASEGDRVSGFG
jgi:hypothetical protein